MTEQPAPIRLKRGRRPGKTDQTLLKEVKAQELKELAESNSDSHMVIEGIRIDPIKYKAFEAFCQTGSVDKAVALMAEGGYTVARRTFFNWKNDVWWKILHERMFKEAQEIFSKRLSENAEVFATGLIRIAKGEDKTDRTAMATVRAAEVFATVGRDPLIQRSPHVLINNNQKYNTIITGERLAEVLNLMDPAEMMEFTLTGKLPEKYNEQAPIQIEATTVEPVPAGIAKSADPVG